MKIYTKTGDDGTTSLFGGQRVLKSNPQVETFGNVDELSSFVGLLISKKIHKNHKILFTSIQKNLHDIMAFLSGSKINLTNLAKDIIIFEQTIDEIDLKLPKLNSFILPQGTEISVLFHICRTVCRRAERNVVRYSRSSEIISYLNRLSDLLFVMARFYNTKDILI